MVDVVQLVRTLDCGSRGRRFESGLPPFKSPCNKGLFFMLKPKIYKGFRNEKLKCTSVKISTDSRLADIALAMVRIEKRALYLMAFNRTL